MRVALEDRSACLLANHGMIYFGANLRTTPGLAVDVEAPCQQYMLGRKMGTLIILDDAEIAIVLERFKTCWKLPADVLNSSPAFAPTRRD
jgi:L-fuculose-phosphate aldolase